MRWISDSSGGGEARSLAGLRCRLIVGQHREAFQARWRSAREPRGLHCSTSADGRDGSVAALITKATGRRSACRTPRVGEVRPFRPRVLKTKEFRLTRTRIGWTPARRLATVGLDGPSRERADQSPAGKAAAIWGQTCYSNDCYCRSSGHLDTKADCLSPPLRPFVHRGCRCALPSLGHTPDWRARRQTNSPHGLNRPPERPSAEHATPADCLHSRPSGASMTTAWFITETSSGAAR